MKPTSLPASPKHTDSQEANVRLCQQPLSIPITPGRPQKEVAQVLEARTRAIDSQHFQKMGELMFPF